MSEDIVRTDRATVAADSFLSTNGDSHEASLELLSELSGETLESIRVGDLSIASYASTAGQDKVDALVALASDLKGARVLHLNSTAYGGGVAELLRSHIPLLRSLGIDADWKIIRGDDPFFNVTKGFHNALQGGVYELDDAGREVYLATNARNSKHMGDGYDFIVVHDPQPLAIRLFHGDAGAKWVWRCHIDTSAPNAAVWQFLKPYTEPYDAMVFTMDQYVSPDLPREKVSLMPPAIDPLSPKNLPLSKELCRRIINWVGIDPDRPLVTQVSRFDPWKDPMGVIQAYRLVREQVPDLQLAMLGHLAMDDPEGWQIYDQVVAATKDDPDIYLFTNYTAASSIEVNAFQRYSDVIIQKSIREGFGLVVSEALWKGSPVVAGRAGGIPLQLEDGQDGYLVDSVEECAEKVLYLLQHPAKARKMGQSGRRHIRSGFLTPRLLSDEISLLRSLK